MKKLVLLSTAFVLLMVSGVFAFIGECPYTITDYGNGYTRTNITCTANSTDGSYPSTTITIPSGYITRIITDPGGTAPDDDYDISLTDVFGLSVATLTNRDATNTEEVDPTVKFYSGTFTLAITNNSVNSAITTIYIYSVR